MKVYTKISLDIDSWEVKEEISYDYHGPVVECKGGGGGDSVDPWYNARMATIAEEQQKIAEEYYEFWQTSGQKELEAQTAQANLSLLPQQTELQSAQMAADMELLPMQTEYQKTLMDYNTEDLAARKPLAQKYYEEAMSGDDPNAKAAEARAGVAQQIDAGRSSMRREAARMGADVNSARFQRNIGNAGLERSRAIAGSMQQARNEAKDKNFQKMEAAMSKPLGVGM